MSYAKDIFYFIVGVTIEESLTIAIICIAIGNRDIAIVLRSIVEVLLQYYIAIVFRNICFHLMPYSLRKLITKKWWSNNTGTMRFKNQDVKTF